MRENGTLLESSRGLSGIDEIKQLFGAKRWTVDTGADNAAGKLTFNIDGLARAIAPLRDACHWAENKNMAMDLRDPNVWISHLLENLPEEKLGIGAER
ncbi:type VI secretion-associated protein [Escherichia coli]|uniref:Type VI secretion-associated protein n=1 Tax=Escherichia coli TaxID=562 RepID=A0A377DIA5_ECOLX|nr:type VI secretion-associated protein [Escherichia coli]